MEKNQETPLFLFVTAINNVMEEVDGIQKNSIVGSGANSYKGMKDSDVKKEVSKSMRKNGLAILPIENNAKTTIERWTETTNYGDKTKQSVFVEIETKYKLMHKGGHVEIVSGYGHGVDSQDKSAGKSTTYALKNLLRYIFLIADEKIDDTDNTHSDDLPIAPKAKEVKLDIDPVLADEINRATTMAVLTEIAGRWGEAAKSDTAKKMLNAKAMQINPNLVKK